MARRLLKHIPNNEQGNKFISELRNYIDRDIVKVVKCRGRGSRKNATGYMKDLTHEQAEKFAVYFEFDDQANYEQKYYRADSRLKSLEKTLQFLFQKTDLINIINQIQQDIDDIRFLSHKYNDLVNLKSSTWEIKQGLETLLEIKGEK